MGPVLAALAKMLPTGARFFTPGGRRVDHPVASAWSRGWKVNINGEQLLFDHEGRFVSAGADNRRHGRRAAAN